MGYKRTRVKGQDMKTGEFAYLDQLIKDGYYPNLWVLPKNYDPPQPVGESIRLPLDPIFNFSPPNIVDNTLVPVISLVNEDTGQGVLLPFSADALGIALQSIAQNIQGASSAGQVGSVIVLIEQNITGTASAGQTGTVTYLASNNITGIASAGIANSSGVIVQIVGNTTQNVTGIASNGQTGTVLNGSGWGQGGGWSSNGWSQG